MLDVPVADTVGDSAKALLALIPAGPNAPAVMKDDFDLAALIDDRPLVELAKAIDRDELIDLILAWVHSMSERLTELANCTDRDAIRKAAHDLMGTGGTFGAHSLSAAAARLEQACIDSRPDITMEQREIQRIGWRSIAAMRQRWQI